MPNLASQSDTSNVAKSDPENGYRRKRREVSVLGHNRYAVAHCRRCDPGVVATDATVGLQLGCSDPREAACRLGVDRDERVGRANLCERRESASSSVGVLGAENAELEFGGSDDGDGDLVGEVIEIAAGLLGDEDRRVGDRAGHSSSTGAPRTSARSSSKPASAGASRTMRRNSEQDTHGLRRSTCGTMSATGSRLTVSVSSSPARTAATTAAVLLRRSRTETS